MDKSNTRNFYSYLVNKHWVFTLILVLIFGLGALIRFYDLTDAPLDFHPTRQLHSILMARGMYAENNPALNEVQRNIAIQQWQLEGLIEPPIMERLVSFTYQILGSEILWVARVYSILFWLVGGLGLYLLVKQVSNRDAGLISIIYFLFLPYAAIASRTFQPDPLLVAAIIWAWWTAVKWAEKAGWKWTIIAGLTAGLAIFIKSTAVFFLIGGYAGLVLWGKGFKLSFKDKYTWVLIILAIIPYGCFHFYGTLITGQLVSQFSLRFFPQLWLQPAFYLQWIGQINGTVGLPWFLTTILAIFLIENKSHRAFFGGILIGYFLYGMTFTHHITTHDYYHLPLIPVVAAGLGISASKIINQLKGPGWLTRLVTTLVLLGYIGINAWDVRVTLKRDDYRTEAIIWQKLGASLGEGSKVVGLLHDYGARLSYWGWKIPTNWMTSGDMRYRELAGQTFDFDQLFTESTAGKEYFVVTLFGEYDSQPALKSKLENGFPVYVKTNDYIIFDLMHPKAGAKP